MGKPIGGTGWWFLGPLLSLCPQVPGAGVWLGLGRRLALHPRVPSGGRLGGPHVREARGGERRVLYSPVPILSPRSPRRDPAEPCDHHPTSVKLRELQPLSHAKRGAQPSTNPALALQGQRWLGGSKPEPPAGRGRILGEFWLSSSGRFPPPAPDTQQGVAPQHHHHRRGRHRPQRQTHLLQLCEGRKSRPGPRFGPRGDWRVPSVTPPVLRSWW